MPTASSEDNLRYITGISQACITCMVKQACQKRCRSNQPAIGRKSCAINSGYYMISTSSTCRAAVMASRNYMVINKAWTASTSFAKSVLIFNLNYNVMQYIGSTKAKFSKCIHFHFKPKFFQSYIFQVPPIRLNLQKYHLLV